MPFTIFYSWQSRTVAKYNRNFIEECLKQAIKELKKELKDDSPDFYLDRATKDLPGMPNIPTTTEKKIKSSDVFVGDLSFTSYTDTTAKKGGRSFVDLLLGRNKWIQEGVSNSNVVQELGIAQGIVKGSERIVTVMNLVYGDPSQMHFDIKQSLFPITYSYDESTTSEQRTIEKKKLINNLRNKIKEILETEHERQKEIFYPFSTWKEWDKIIGRTFKFERTDYISQQFSEILENINTQKTIIRFCGLSGIGKTRMLFECFIDPDTEKPNVLANKILYVDANDQDDVIIKNSIKDLLSANESKILLIDNCSIELHNSITANILNENSRLSFISVSTNPEERIQQLRSSEAVRLMILDNLKCKELVYKILEHNFPEFQKEELQLLVDFSSGISFIAELMATNKERNKHTPGTLTVEEVVQRLLGPLYDNKESLSAIYACCLFSKFGYEDDLEYQTNLIALNEDLFDIDTTGINAADIEEWKLTKFKSVCKQLKQRQLLEKKGRTLIFRPSPLAVRMAEDWWNKCTVGKFERLLPVLKDANLVESFCEQFRFLKHVENAKNIVKNLCEGFFNSAEVLNTQVGSRLFRSFVYIEPIACSNTLANAFLHFSKDELKNIFLGRRNLIWALEKLCFRSDTFAESTKVLLAFAVGENENIANNATGQFSQLFHIRLPGTAANLNERWKIIEYSLGLETDYQGLGLSAMSSALHADHFTRMGGAEDQGDSEPLRDYNPTGGEVYEYWKKIILQLTEFVKYSEIHRERALGILLRNFYSLCVQGLANVIIPIMRNFVELGIVDRMEVRTRIQSILNSDQLNSELIKDELQILFEVVAPINFSDKFKIFVQQPSPDEYRDENGSRNGDKLSDKIDLLAKEFIKNEDKWEEFSELFMQPNIAEGMRFGKYLFINSDEDTCLEIINILISQLQIADTKNRNLSIFLGILSELKDKDSASRVFYKVLDVEILKPISFSIARSTQLKAEEIKVLIEETKKGNFSSQYFSEFQYGWGIRHLKDEEVFQIIESLREVDDLAKMISFYILATWVYNDVALFQRYRTLLRDILLKDTTAIFTYSRQSMDLYYYDEILLKFLNEGDDIPLAEMSIKTIIEQSNNYENFYWKEGGFYKILDVLQEKYFTLFWEELSKIYLDSDNLVMSVFNLKDILKAEHDYYRQSEGLLFKGGQEKFEIVFKWCQAHKGPPLYNIAALLPLFSEERNSQNQWHPYAMDFINEFGDDPRFLSELSAKLGTYSWVGSVVPKLESDKSLFEPLTDHPKETVREWAIAHLQELTERIRWENNRDQDGVWA